MQKRGTVSQFGHERMMGADANSSRFIGNVSADLFICNWNDLHIPFAWIQHRLMLTLNFLKCIWNIYICIYSIGFLCCYTSQSFEQGPICRRLETLLHPCDISVKTKILYKMTKKHFSVEVQLLWHGIHEANVCTCITLTGHSVRAAFYPPVSNNGDICL